MPRTRSTFTKRQKEQTRQQKQRDKAALRTQRKLDKQADPGSEESLEELRKNAEAQASLFGVPSAGATETNDL
ncbi:MAG: hypothetical protein WB817_13350 [Terriglobales bacterium]